MYESEHEFSTLAIKIYLRKKNLETVLACTKFPEIQEFPGIPYL